ncbi:MAG: AMP-binding protein, partial [Myxococcales bacterium]|nr:AMP-binding protein [Myxococcales bacterium]
SAGETLPAPVFEEWTAKTGKPILDGIGTTELLHIFISNRLGEAAPATTGRPVTGYIARVVDEEMNEKPRGEVGKLAVRGPTGCRYLNDERQKDYVKDGWNITGDAFFQDDDGLFHFVARADDMIISSGYNIAGPEVEAALLAHADVVECAVVGAPDQERGQILHMRFAGGVANFAHTLGEHRSHQDVFGRRDAGFVEKHHAAAHPTRRDQLVGFWVDSTTQFFEAIEVRVESSPPDHVPARRVHLGFGDTM